MGTGQSSPMQVSINNVDGRDFVTADHYLQESEKRGEQNSMPGVSKLCVLRNGRSQRRQMGGGIFAIKATELQSSFAGATLTSRC